MDKLNDIKIHLEGTLDSGYQILASPEKYLKQILAENRWAINLLIDIHRQLGWVLVLLIDPPLNLA